MGPLQTTITKNTLLVALQLLEHTAQGFGIILSAILLINETLCKVTEFTLLESYANINAIRAICINIFTYRNSIQYLLDFTSDKHSTRRRTYKRNLKGQRM